MKHLAFWFTFIVAACAPTRDADWPDGCRDRDLAAIAALHAAELVEACSAHDTLEACPVETREAIDARYDDRYSAWERCER